MKLFTLNKEPAFFTNLIDLCDKPYPNDNTHKMQTIIISVPDLTESAASPRLQLTRLSYLIYQVQDVNFLQTA